MEPSSKSSGAIRTFTVEEANDLLPHITKMLDKAIYLNVRIKSLTSDIENLVSIWGKDILDKTHMDNELYMERVSEIVLLCWKYGEDNINFLHELDNGFKNRKPLDEME